MWTNIPKIMPPIAQLSSFGCLFNGRCAGNVIQTFDDVNEQCPYLCIGNDLCQYWNIEVNVTSTPFSPVPSVKTVCTLHRACTFATNEADSSLPSFLQIPNNLSGPKGCPPNVTISTPPPITLPTVPPNGGLCCPTPSQFCIGPKLLKLSSYLRFV